jgi:ketosteroid isomerase-like protein
MTQTPVDTVTTFYKAVSAADADAISAVIDSSFADDAAIEWPPSLPHGGRIVGARTLRGLFSAIVRPGSPVPGPANLALVRAIGDTDEVVAWITFDWADPATGTRTPNSALELWRFTDGKVSEILAYYWDHAAVNHPQPA